MVPQQCCCSSWTPNLVIMNSKQLPPPKKSTRQNFRFVALHVFMSLNRDAGRFPILQRLLLTQLKQSADNFHPSVIWGLSNTAAATVRMLSLNRNHKTTATRAAGNQSLWIPPKPYVASTAWSSEVGACLTYCCSSADRREGWCCSREAVRDVSTVSPLTSSPWTTVYDGSLAKLIKPWALSRVSSIHAPVQKRIQVKKNSCFKHTSIRRKDLCFLCT